MVETAEARLADIDLTDLERWVTGTPYDWFAVLRREAPAYWQEERDGRGTSASRGRGRSASRRSRPRAPRGQNKAAVFGVIAERQGVTVTEIAQVTGIAKPLIYNTTRAGVERGELERVALPGGQQGFRAREQAPASDAAAPVS